MYRITWFIEEAWDAVVFGFLSLIARLDNPKLWGNVKLIGLTGFSLYCMWATVVVYNSPGAQADLIVRISATTLFVLCTVMSFLMLIYYGRQQAKQDALMG